MFLEINTRTGTFIRHSRVGDQVPGIVLLNICNWYLILSLAYCCSELSWKYLYHHLVDGSEISVPLVSGNNWK